MNSRIHSARYLKKSTAGGDAGFWRGYPYAPCRQPHPARAFAGGYLCNSPAPLLRRLFRGSTHTPLPAAPTLPAPAAGDTRALLPTAPTPPAPLQAATHTLLPAPPPRPRLRRSSPAPSWGRGPCPDVYQVGHRARVFSGISPCAGPWGYRHGGRGRRGGGTRSPSPVSHTPTILLLAGSPRPTRAFGAPPPPPPGVESVRGDIR